MRRRWLVICLIYAVLIVGGWALGSGLSQWTAIDMPPMTEHEIRRVVLAVSSIYLVVSAVPFIPGAEIGFGLIAVFGGRVVFVVYVCMVMALMLAYCVGRFVPARIVAASFGYVGLARARDLVLRMDALDPAERASMLLAHAPNRFLSLLLRYRWVALALALNLPGNTLVGGGGGLALVAGMSGLFPLWPFAVTVALAVAPLPLLVLLTGYQP